MLRNAAGVLADLTEQHGLKEQTGPVAPHPAAGGSKVEKAEGQTALEEPGAGTGEKAPEKKEEAEED